MRAKTFVPILSVVAIVAGVLLVTLYTPRSAGSQAVTSDDSVLSFRMRFGITDTEPRAWDGSLTVSGGGEALRIRSWRQRPGDKIDGARGWSLSTRKGPNFDRRPWEEEVPSGVIPYINVPGVIVDLKLTAATSVQVETRQGTFVVTPRVLETGKAVSVLGGSVVIDLVPTAQMISDRKSVV